MSTTGATVSPRERLAEVLAEFPKAEAFYSGTEASAALLVRDDFREYLVLIEPTGRTSAAELKNWRRLT